MNPKYAIKQKDTSIYKGRLRKNKIKIIKEKEYWNEKKYIKEEKMIIDCKKCEECRAKKAKDWATRGYMESKTSTKSMYITLSYDGKNLPLTKKGRPTLKKEDVTKFKKRLRKYISGNNKTSTTIRTLECGEYGAKYGRPHYHMIIWGYKIDDLVFFKKNKYGDPLYISKKMEKIWGNGFVTIGIPNYECIGYVANYCQSKINKEKITDERTPEYINMSRGKNNSIGIKYWNENKEKIKENKYILVKTIKGIRVRNIPEYISNKWKKEVLEEAESCIELYEYMKKAKILRKQEEKINKIIKEMKGKITDEIKNKYIKNHTYLAKKHANEISEILYINQISYENLIKSDWKKFKEETKKIAEEQINEELKKTNLKKEEYYKMKSNSKNKFLENKKKERNREITIQRSIIWKRI